MNILLITGKYFPIYNKDLRGSLEGLLRTYFECNAFNGDKITVYSPKIAKDNYDSKKIANITFRNVDLTTLRYRILKYFYAFKHRIDGTGNNEFYIREIIKDFKRRKEVDLYDLIIFENEEKSIPIFRKKTKTKTRIALHMHNDYINIERKYSKTILDNCDEVWCVSSFIESRVKEVKNIKTIVIPNAVGHFPEPSLKIIHELKKKYNPDDNVIFMFVGRFLEIKGINELVDAFNIYNGINPKSKLIIIGDCDLGFKNHAFVKRIRSASLANRNISLVGYKKPSEIAAYYKIADAQIVPSKCNEAFGLVILEAMQAGVKIIASSHGALSEICMDKVSYISKSNMVDDLVKAMSKVAILAPLPEGYYDDILSKYTKDSFVNNFRKAIHDTAKL